MGTVLLLTACAVGGIAGTTPTGAAPSALAPGPAAGDSCDNPAGASLSAAGGAFASVLGGVLSCMPDINPCALVKQADVQALFSVPLGTYTTDHTGDCTWPLSDPSKGDGLDIVVNVGRGEGPLDNDMGSPGELKPINGIGDRASWGLLAGYFPHLGAVKGTYTCELTIGGGNGQLSVPSTGKEVFAKIDASALPGFMQHLGALCGEIFAGLGA